MAALDNADGVSDMGIIVLIMSLQLLGAVDLLLIKRVQASVADSDYDGLVHLVAGNHAYKTLLSGFHISPSYFALRIPKAYSWMMVFSLAICLLTFLV